MFFSSWLDVSWTPVSISLGRIYLIDLLSLFLRPHVSIFPRFLSLSVSLGYLSLSPPTSYPYLPDLISLFLLVSNLDLS
jgi:hypothetical protein